jgi:hypothetical protein
MNPLIKDTVNKIESHFNYPLSQGLKMCIAVEIGNALQIALISAKENPNCNLNGGDYVNENTIGYFDVMIFRHEKEMRDGLSVAFEDALRKTNEYNAKLNASKNNTQNDKS